MSIKLTKNLNIYIAFFCITLSWGNFFIENGVSKFLEYLGIFLILYGIYVRKYTKKDIKKLLLLLCILLPLTIGLILQELKPSIKINALLSMFILASIAVMPCKYMTGFNTYIGIEKSIIYALIVNLIISLIMKDTLITPASEGVFFKFGFDFGILHRNFLAYIFLSICIIEYLKIKLGLTHRKVGIFLIISLITLTNSRSGIIILFLFLFLSNIDRFRASNYLGTSLILPICFVLVIIGIQMFKFFFNNSETFSYRFNGIVNYLNMFSNNIKIMLLGNLKIAHINPILSYNENIRSIIGYNTSTEFVFFNILIKNGVIGFAGYFIIMTFYMKKILSLKNKKYMAVSVAILLCFIISAFVESFMANINHLFSIFVYMFMANLEKFDFDNRNNIFMCKV